MADPRALVAILDGQQRISTLNIGLYGSLAHKLPRKRVDSLDAYPAKRLHVDLIPLAGYVHQRGLDESYVTSATPSVRADRAIVRHWTIRTILSDWGVPVGDLGPARARRLVRGVAGAASAEHHPARAHGESPPDSGDVTVPDGSSAYRP